MPRRKDQVNANGRPQRCFASVRVAAERYNVDPRTVRRWIAEGRVTGYRVGAGSVKVDLNEADERVVEVIPAARPRL